MWRRSLSEVLRRERLGPEAESFGWDAERGLFHQLCCIYRASAVAVGTVAFALSL
jgi:hypothetical protein